MSDLGPWVVADEVPMAAQRCLTAAGLRLLEDDLLDRTLEGPPVYFFGDRRPLPIRDLLFYWQD